MEKDPRLEDALFRYQIIAPLLDPDLRRGEKVTIMRRLAQRMHTHPSGEKRRYKYPTIKEWYKLYRRGGFDALFPKGRSDKGKPRSLSDEIIEKASQLKLELPSRSLSTIIDILEREGDIEKGKVSISTLARALSSRGISGRILHQKEVFRRYCAEFPNDLWQSDQYYGPYIPHPKDPAKKSPTQLFLFLDDASRLVCHAQFYHDGSLLSLEDTFRKAILRRGVPKKTYFDNAKVYSSSQMRSVCASLGIQPIYAQPYSPEGKGKVERFLGYLDSQFIPEVKKSGVDTLERLNELLWAWIERRYHRKEHSEIGNTPLDAWMEYVDRIRFASDDEIRKAFLWRERRVVGKACTVKLLGDYYEVFPALANKKVELRYDPHDLSHILVFYNGEFFQKAYPLEPRPDVGKRESISHDESIRDTGIDYLGKILKDHKSAQKEELKGVVPLKRASTENFTLLELLSLLEEKGLAVGEYERGVVRDCFNTYSPFKKEIVEKALDLAVEFKGKGQHITFYLDKIVQLHKERR